MVSGVLIAVFPDRVHRFCSAVIAAGALCWPRQTMSRTAADALGADPRGGGALPRTRRVASGDETMQAEIVEPVMYGLAIALFALLIVSTAVAIFDAASDIKDVRRC